MKKRNRNRRGLFNDRDFHTVLLWDTSTCVCVGTCRDSDDILSWSHAARGTDCIIRG